MMKTPHELREEIGALNDEELLDALSAPMSSGNAHDLEVIAEALHRILIRTDNIQRNMNQNEHVYGS